MNDNITVPEYIKDAMKNDEKKYGTSVFDYIPEKDKETSSPKENDFFNSNEYDMNQIEKDREEIRQDMDKKITEKTAVDALSGIKTSVPEETISMADLVNDFENSVENIRGKKITNYGRNLIKDLIGELPTEDEEKLISSKIEENIDTIKKVNFYNMDTDLLESFLSDRIIDQLKSISDESSYKNILSRFLEQIYIPYSNTTSYRDDISELNKLAKDLDASGVFDNIDTSDDKNDDTVHKSLSDIQDQISLFMTKLKNLDDRNSRLKQDYTINDIDTRLVGEVKCCLDDALNFTSVKNKVNNTLGKFKKDLKRTDAVNHDIEDWIHSIKHDPHTLYTFPCNDYLSDSESREELIKFFINSYMVDILSKNNIDLPAEKDLFEGLNELGYCTAKDLERFKRKAWITLYVISRTFKYNKIENDKKYVRILSYTLDLISKLGIKDHRDKFIEVSDFIYEKLS